MIVQTVVPMVSYEDVAAAAEWLCSAFGFTEDFRVAEGGGRVTHVQLQFAGGILMAGWPGPHYQSPRHHADGCEDARRWLDSPFVVDGVYVRVDDIDAHFERARAAGARILTEVEDNIPAGQRQYRAEDVEGHRWMFAEPL